MAAGLVQKRHPERLIPKTGLTHSPAKGRKVAPAAAPLGRIPKLAPGRIRPCRCFPAAPPAASSLAESLDTWRRNPRVDEISRMPTTNSESARAVGADKAPACPSARKSTGSARLLEAVARLPCCRHRREATDTTTF
eukprot:scaffold250451_cov26-Tisochrysis_lutea.AAC.2